MTSSRCSSCRRWCETTATSARYAFTQPFDTYAAWATHAAERWNRVKDLTLDNGMRVRLVQSGSLPIMFVHARIPGGTLVEPAGRHGVAEVMLNSMGLSGRTYRERRYRIGMHWGWETNPEFLTYGIKFLSVYADQGLTLAAEVLSSPRFLRRTVNNTRDRLAQNLVDADRDIDALAYRALLKARGLERAEPAETTQSLQAVDRGAVADFHAGLFYPENVILTITSDRPVAELEPLVRRHFGGWNASGKPGTDIGALSPKGPAGGGEKTIIVPVDGTSQSRILLGFDAPGWHDWQGAVASQAVSELLQTKLRRLRTAMGVTYDADVWTRTLRNTGSLNLSIKVNRNATDSAIEQLLRIVDDLCREPVTEGELDFVRRRLISDTIGRGSTNSAIASAHGDLMFKGRQTDYFGKVVAYLKELELADLQAAVDARLGQLGILVVVGQAPELPKKPGGPLGRFGGEPVQYAPAELLD